MQIESIAADRLESAAAVAELLGVPAVAGRRAGPRLAPGAGLSGHGRRCSRGAPCTVVASGRSGVVRVVSAAPISSRPRIRWGR